MQSTDGIVYVIGHTNPDTDSLCSAIAYAYLKNATAPKDQKEKIYYAARRARLMRKVSLYWIIFR
mgnify:CR=1 FL=1